MRRHLQLQLTVPIGLEFQAARAIWGSASPEERQVLGRLAAEFVLLSEVGTDTRVLIAPAATLEAAGLPVSNPEGR